MGTGLENYVTDEHRNTALKFPYNDDTRGLTKTNSGRKRFTSQSLWVTNILTTIEAFTHVTHTAKNKIKSLLDNFDVT